MKRSTSRGLARFPLRGVARSMVLVGGGTALGQAALAIASPVLSRLFDPHAFGVLSVYSAVTAVLVTLASLRYDFAIPIAEDAAEAIRLFVLCVLLGGVVSLGLGLLVFAWGSSISMPLGDPSLAGYLWLLPVGVFVLAIGQAMAGWATFQRSFGELARWRALQGVGQAVSQVALGLLHTGPAGLVAGDVVGRLVGMQRLLRSLVVTLARGAISVADLRRVARERWPFARVMTVASLLNALTTQIPFLLIPWSFGLQASGQYFLAYRILVLPASLVSAAFNQVFFGEAAKRRDDGQALHDLALNGTVSLLLFAIPTYTIVAIGGGSLITFVFGTAWTDAGTFAQVIAPALILWATAHPISSLLLIGRREVESLGFTAAELAVRTLALGVGVIANSLLLGIVLLSIASVGLGVASLWRFLRVASVTLGELTRPTVRTLALTLPGLGLVLAATAVVPALVPVAMGVAWLVSLALVTSASPEFRTILASTDD